MSSEHLALVVIAGFIVITVVAYMAIAARVKISANEARIAEAEARKTELAVIALKARIDSEEQ